MKRLAFILTLCALLTACSAVMHTTAEPLEQTQAVVININPLPDVVNTNPEPGATISASEAESICVNILVQTFLRPGDYWDHFDNIKANIDGEPLPAKPSHETLDSLVGITDENGNDLAIGPYADAVCWETQLEPGVYIIEALLWTSTGEEYTIKWSFEVAK